MNEGRRKFLKIVLIGGTSFIAGKILGPLFSKFLDSLPTETNSSKVNATAFQVVENRKGLSIYDDAGEEIFQIDNGA